MLQNIIIGILSLIVIIWGLFFLIGVFIGTLSYILKLIFYSSVILTIRFIIMIFRQALNLLKMIYFKIYNSILDKLYPDKGAYLIKFSKENRMGTTKIKYVSIR